MKNVRIFVGAVVGLLAIGASTFALRRYEPRRSQEHAHDLGRSRSNIELHVPRFAGGIAFDGELDEPAWTTTVARTGAFVDSAGRPGKPYSDARFMWGNGFLYLALYAADEDVQASPDSRPQSLAPADDRFHFEVTVNGKRFVFEVNPAGVVDARAFSKGVPDATWRSDLKVGHDLDGTLNDSTDDDEEWVLEMGIPLTSIGLQGVPNERMEFLVRRCDTPHRGPRMCNGWGDDGQSAVLVLE